MERKMEDMTGFKIKIIEEIWEKVVEMLHSTNPWRGEDCGRQGSWICQTKKVTGKNKTQDCTKRSLVYETWCETCHEEEEIRIEDKEISDEKKKEAIQGIRL